MAQQAAELEDTDIPPVKLPSPVAALQTTTPASRTCGHESPALQTSASLPAASAAAQAAETGAACMSSTLTHSVSLPMDKPAQTVPADVPAASSVAASDTKASDTKASVTKASDTKASDTKASDFKASDNKATDAQGNAAAAPIDTAQAADKSIAQLKRVPYSPKQRSSSELHSAASNSTSPAAVGAGAAAAGGSQDMSQKSRSKVWLPPMALTSPRTSSGRTVHDIAHHGTSMA